jgi:hypothetical protein
MNRAIHIQGDRDEINNRITKTRTELAIVQLPVMQNDTNS